MDNQPGRWRVSGGQDRRENIAPLKGERRKASGSGNVCGGDKTGSDLAPADKVCVEEPINHWTCPLTSDSLWKLSLGNGEGSSKEGP